MTKPNGEQERNEAYKTLANSLQTLVIIFFGFILFFSYVLVPYYFMGDKYQSEKNIVYFLPMMDNNLSFIRETFQNFSGNNTNYKNGIHSINVEGDEYIKKISSTEQLYDKYNTNITTPQNDLKSMIEKNASSAKTYPICYVKSNFIEWISCNAKIHRTDSEKEKYVVLDIKTTQAVDGKMHTVKNLVDRITLYDDKAEILNASDLKKWHDIINNWNQMLSRSYGSQKINYLSMENYLNPIYYAQPLNSPKAKNLTTAIENEIKSYTSKLESLEYPIIGKVPVVNINWSFISFPFLIAIGFSFLSLQFKRLIKIHKDMNLDNMNEQHKLLMSWIDPLQSFPEKIYPLITIIVPSVLFVLFSYFIWSLWYQIDPYMLGSIAGDLLWIPNSIMVIFSISIVSGAAILALSYYQIIRAWRSYTKSDRQKTSSRQPIRP